MNCAHYRTTNLTAKKYLVTTKIEKMLPTSRLPGKAYDEADTAAYSLTKRRASGVCTPGIIRRLLPVECERLMGFPDGWTLIPWRGKPAEQCPDGPRYKALGNSMCTNVMAWIGERIQAAEDSNGR